MNNLSAVEYKGMALSFDEVGSTTLDSLKIQVAMLREMGVSRDTTLLIHPSLVQELEREMDDDTAFEVTRLGYPAWLVN